MIMTGENSKPAQDMAKHVERYLRRLPQPKVPPAVEDRLLSVFPAIERETISHRGSQRYRNVAALAACLILAFGAISYWCAITFSTKPQPKKVTAAYAGQDISRIIQREVITARLQASAQILSEQPGGGQLAEDTFRYLATAYPDTVAGKEIGNLIFGRNEK
jgi:hypothetical protein